MGGKMVSTLYTKWAWNSQARNSDKLPTEWYQAFRVDILITVSIPNVEYDRTDKYKEKTDWEVSEILCLQVF